jgi:hypothetical protein
MASEPQARLGSLPRGFWPQPREHQLRPRFVLRGTSIWFLHDQELSRSMMAVLPDDSAARPKLTDSTWNQIRSLQGVAFHFLVVSVVGSRCQSALCRRGPFAATMASEPQARFGSRPWCPQPRDRLAAAKMQRKGAAARPQRRRVGQNSSKRNSQKAAPRSYLKPGTSSDSRTDDLPDATMEWTSTHPAQTRWHLAQALVL